MKICLYDHHNYIIPTDGIGGVIGAFQILYQGLLNEDVHLTLIINDSSPLESEKNLEIIKLPFDEIENIRWGRTKVTNYFNGDIFHSNSSGRHVNFDFSDFKGIWVATCQGCLEYVGKSDCQVFVSNNQLSQHFRDNLFDTFCNQYMVIHNRVNTDEYFWVPGSHDRLVWMGRVDGAKAERLYDIAKNSKEKIYAAGWYTNDFEWLFDKIMSTGNVEWIGEVKGTEQKRIFYSKAKASIHCSTFEDPCPITVLEAQACGVPVISYSNGSLSEICENKNYLFDNLEDIVSFINNNQLSNETTKEKTRKFILDNFDSKDYSKLYLKLFQSLWKK